MSTKLKYKGPNDKSLKMQKQEYDKFFKDVCKLIDEFNKNKGKLEKVVK